MHSFSNPPKKSRMYMSTSTHEPDEIMHQGLTTHACDARAQQLLHG
uniref:Uncharacterized protein n=1 Tax=Aegilops tauschii subsp. strangulata TaxID=200361 RepID=A0A453I5A6_AEGTS